MALLWFDGFDQYNISESADAGPYMQGVYSVLSSSSSHLRINTMPEIGTRCVSTSTFTSGLSNGEARLSLPIPSKTSGFIGVGFHFYAISTSSNLRIMSFSEGLSTTRVSLSYVDGAFSLYNGLSGASETTGPDFPSSILYHIEVRMSFGGSSSGSVELRINGQTVLTLSGQTFTSAVDNIKLFVRAGASGTATTYIDNFYVYDETGDENNDWLGERNVYTLFPDTDGSETDWTLSTGSDGYDLINDVPPGSEYLEALNVTDVSSFGFDLLPSADINIIGVRTEVSASKTGTNTTEVSFGPAGYRGVSHALTQDQYLRFSDLWENNPDTGESWDPGEVNSFEIEIERDS